MSTAYSRAGGSESGVIGLIRQFFVLHFVLQFSLTATGFALLLYKRYPNTCVDEGKSGRLLNRRDVLRNFLVTTSFDQLLFGRGWPTSSRSTAPCRSHFRNSFRERAKDRYSRVCQIESAASVTSPLDQQILRRPVFVPSSRTDYCRFAGFHARSARQGFHSRRTHRSGALKALLQDHIPTIKPDQCTISSSGTQKS
jgi:hypothetical protein